MHRDRTDEPSTMTATTDNFSDTMLNIQGSSERIAFRLNHALTSRLIEISARTDDAVRIECVFDPLRRVPER